MGLIQFISSHISLSLYKSLSVSAPCPLFIAFVIPLLLNSLFCVLHWGFAVPETKEVVIHKYKTPMVRFQYLYITTHYTIHRNISSVDKTSFFHTLISGTSDLLLGALSLLLHGGGQGEGGGGQTQDAVSSSTTKLVEHTRLQRSLQPAPEMPAIHRDYLTALPSSF